MLTRRDLIRAACLAPGLSPFVPVRSESTDASRIALVIGNSAYSDAPLANPVNDAKAVGGLLSQAGFAVTSQLNSKRLDMLAAIQQFSLNVKKPETKLVVFYYAGHGAQLDWRNYLLPVDAAANSAAELRQSCIDLNLLMAQLASSKDKTFVIVLDACRNNPFGSTYQPEQKGLSQFDAPAGSLLAYATSPGNVASDGIGQNGLYTENLIRELSVRGARIEDALKRVRLNVRLASKGAQIPWETTSLEGDVFIFNEGQKKLSEAEQEKLLEADLNEWARIKTSQNLEDWVSYLRNFPNGRFTEIAQTRMARLLAKVETPVQNQAANLPSPDTTKPVAASQPAITISAGAAIPNLMQVSTNPYSAGRYPLGRKYSVGDTATVRSSDIFTNVEGPTQIFTVTKVDLDAERVEYNNGETIVDTMGNYLRTVRGGDSDIPQQIHPAELQVGKKWEAGWRQQNPKFGPETVSLKIRIAAFEKVRVPAGEFDAFRLEMDGWSTFNTGPIRREAKLWLVPGLNFAVKGEFIGRSPRRIVASDRFELASMRQQTIDTRCAVPSSDLKRTLVIKNSCA